MDQALGNTTGHFSNPTTAVKAEAIDQKASGPDDVEHGLDSRHVYAGRKWSSDHPLNIRVSIPLAVGRYYIALIAGKERRARARIALDRRQHPLGTSGNILFLAFIFTIATAGSCAVFYFLLAHFFGWSGRLIP